MTFLSVQGGRSGEVTAARHPTRGGDILGRRHSSLMFAALMIGHHLSISALW
jgi:hypothetical protein